MRRSACARSIIERDLRKLFDEPFGSFPRNRTTMDLSFCNALALESDEARALRLKSILGDLELSQVIRYKRVEDAEAYRKEIEGERWDMLFVSLMTSGNRGLKALLDARLKGRSDRLVIALYERDEAPAVVDAAREIADACIAWEEVDASNVCTAIAEFRGSKRECSKPIAENGRELTSEMHLLDQLPTAVIVVSAMEGVPLYENATARMWLGEAFEEAVGSLLEYDLLGTEIVEFELSVGKLIPKRVHLRVENFNWRGKASRLISLQDIEKQKRVEAAFLAYRAKSSNAPPEKAPDSLDEDGVGGSPIGKALIVDDEDVLRMVLESILKAFGYETLAAADGEEALELYADNMNSVSIAIVDMNMPGLSGEEVFKRIRKKSRRIPILVTSGLDEFDSKPFGDFDENSGFLMKPFGASEVRKAVEELSGSPVETNA